MAQEQESGTPNCRVCNGTGKVQVKRHFSFFDLLLNPRHFFITLVHPYFESDCLACNGEGTPRWAPNVHPPSARPDQEETFRREGRIPVRIGNGANDKIGWTKPGSGEVFRDLDVAPLMTVVPAGELMMGRGDADHEKRPPREKIVAGGIELNVGADLSMYDDESPRCKVTINAPFAIGRIPVTTDEWSAAFSSGGVRNRAEISENSEFGAVVNVSLEDAQEYVAWLSKVTGKIYRLTSDAEWEYCCRAGTTTNFPFGNSIEKQKAVFKMESSRARYGGKHDFRTFVLNKHLLNGWGILPFGNVHELCTSEEDRGINLPGRLPVRGGYWFYDAFDLRSAFRRKGGPWTVPNKFTGFRVVRSLEPTA